LEGGQHFCLEFDEVIQPFVILSSYGIGEFCSGLKANGLAAAMLLAMP